MLRLTDLIVWLTSFLPIARPQSQSRPFSVSAEQRS